MNVVWMGDMLIELSDGLVFAESPGTPPKALSFGCGLEMVTTGGRSGNKPPAAQGYQRKLLPNNSSSITAM